MDPTWTDRLVTIVVVIVAGNLFLFLKLFGRGDVDRLVEANRPYYFLLPTLAGLVISLFMLFAEDQLYKPIERRVPFYIQLLLRWAVNSLVIVVVALVVDTGITLLSGATPRAAFAHSLYFLGGELFLSFYLFFILSSFFLHFVKQLGNWFGYGVLLDYFAGRYNQPIEEEKAFLFLDLKNSTGIAEQLGHQKYSRFLNKCFTDLSEVVEKWGGEVYQYVGDEAVVTWDEATARKTLAPVRLFFDFQRLLADRSPEYTSKFGVQPFFKGSLHSGPVILTRVGGRHKEVAYHGDVLNTAARMLELFNKYGHPFLVSEEVVAWEHLTDLYRTGFLSEVVLRGKEKRTRVYGISEGNEW